MASLFPPPLWRRFRKGSKPGTPVFASTPTPKPFPQGGGEHEAMMPNYRYRALNSSGELVSGAVAAAAPGDVAQRIERLGLVLVDNVTLEEGGGSARGVFSIFNKPKAEDVTIFTRDLALLLRAGARINDGLELLAADRDFGRLRPVVADIRSHVVAGESFAEALSL